MMHGHPRRGGILKDRGVSVKEEEPGAAELRVLKRDFDKMMMNVKNEQAQLYREMRSDILREALHHKRQASITMANTSYKKGIVNTDLHLRGSRKVSLDPAGSNSSRAKGSVS